MQTDTPSPNSFDTGRTVPSRLDRDNARQRSKTFGNPTAATPNLQLWQMVYERGRSPSLQAPEGRSNPGAAWIERWIGSPSLAMTRFIVLAMRSAPESSSRDENFSALRPDLRQRMPAVVAGSLTICASSHDQEEKKARKRNADRRVSYLRTLAVRRAQSAARSPLGVPPRLYANGTIHPKAQPGPGFVTHGPNAAGSPPARVALPAMHLARGHSAGRLMPRPPGSGSDEPPPAGTASRSAMRGHRITSLYASESEGHFSKPNCDVKAFLFVQINPDVARRQSKSSRTISRTKIRMRAIYVSKSESYVI